MIIEQDAIRYWDLNSTWRLGAATLHRQPTYLLKQAFTRTVTKCLELLQHVTQSEKRPSSLFRYANLLRRPEKRSSVVQDLMSLVCCLKVPVLPLFFLQTNTAEDFFVKTTYSVFSGQCFMFTNQLLSKILKKLHRKDGSYGKIVFYIPFFSYFLIAPVKQRRIVLLGSMEVLSLSWGLGSCLVHRSQRAQSQEPPSNL